LVLMAPVTTVQNQPDASPAGSQTFDDVIGWIQIVLFSISILGATFVIITFRIFKRIRTYPIKLIMYLCVAIVCSGICFVLAPKAVVHIPWLCTLVGAALHYFLLADFLWCFCIAFNFYQMIVKRNSATRRLEKYYHLISWGLPCIAVIIVAALKAYGLTYGYYGTCYMRGTILVFTTFFLPGLVVISTNCVLFFFVASEIHTTLSKAPETEKRERTKEFRVLMSIFVTVGLSWILTFAASILSPWKFLREIMIVLTTLITPLQGFFIFIAYCINKKVQHKWQGLIAKIPGCGCCTPTVISTSRKGGMTGGGYSSSSKNKSARSISQSNTRGGSYSHSAASQSRDAASISKE